MKTLKAQFIFNSKFGKRYSYITDNPEILEKYGVSLTDTDPDVVFISDKENTVESVKSITKPVILLKGEDCAYIRYNTHRIIKEKNVIGIFSAIMHTPKKLNNLYAYDGKYFFNLIVENNQDNMTMSLPSFKPPRAVLSDKQLDSLKCNITWTPRVPRSQINRTLETKDILNCKRSIDVDFTGSTRYNGNLTEFHRQQLCSKLKTIRDRHSEWNIAIVTKRALKRFDYYQKLRETKICISPWGNGIWCWRDTEAILNGALLIKPDSSCIVSYPNIYTDEFYVPCAINFSDLESIIDEVLNNWKDYEEFRWRAFVKTAGMYFPHKWLPKLASDTINAYDAYKSQT